MTSDHNYRIRREAFEMMEQALKMLDEINENKSAALLDNAIVLLALRPDIERKADVIQPSE